MDRLLAPVHPLDPAPSLPWTTRCGAASASGSGVAAVLGGRDCEKGRRPVSAPSVVATQRAAIELEGFRRYAAAQREALTVEIAAASSITANCAAAAGPPQPSCARLGGAGSNKVFKRLHSAPARRPPLAAGNRLPSSEPLGSSLATGLGEMHMVEREPIYWKAWARPLVEAVKVGPGSYDAAAAVDATRPRPRSARVPSEARLGLVPKTDTELQADVRALRRSTTSRIKRGEPLAAPQDDANTDASARATAADLVSRASRFKYVPGNGHWCDGMATGTSLVGCYNRFRCAGPGAGKYNVDAAHAFLRTHSPRTSFGTSARFPGEQRLPRPPGPQAAALRTRHRPGSGRLLRATAPITAAQLGGVPTSGPG